MTPCAVCEGVNELEKEQDQLPSWNRRGGPKGRGGSKVEMVSLIPMNEWGGELFDPSTTPSLRATPPVPGGELVLLLLQFTPLQTSPAVGTGLFFWYRSAILFPHLKADDESDPSHRISVGDVVIAGLMDGEAAIPQSNFNDMGFTIAR